MEASSSEAEGLSYGASGLGSRFWTLIAATFLAFLGIGTVLPGMALHVRHDLGGSDQTVGFVIGTFSAVALLSRFVSGPLADRKGRKIAFLAGLASCAAAGLAYFLPLGLAGAYLGRGLQGFGEACLYTGAAAWAVETAGLHRSSRALGFVSTGIWGGISAGPLVGTFLGSFDRAAAMQTVMAIAAFALVYSVREDHEPHPEAGRLNGLSSNVLFSGLAIGFVNIHYPVIAGFLILHLSQHGGGGPMAFSAYAGMILLSRFFLGGLPDRLPPAYTFFSGLSLMAVGITTIALTPGPATSLAGAVILGLGFSFPWSSVASVVLKQTPSHKRGSTMGVLSAFYDTFVGSSSFAAGALAARYGYQTAFLMALAGVVLAALAGTVVFKRSQRPVPTRA